MTRMVPLAAVAAVVFVGCQKPSGSGGTPVATTSPAPTPTPAKTPPQPAAVIATAADLQAAEATARTLLASLVDGTLPSVQLTPEFRDLVADPIFDQFGEKWLATWKGKTVPPPGPAAGTADAVVFGTTAGAILRLRLVKVGPEWRIDWLSTGPAYTAEVTAGESFPKFAAAAFFDAFLTNNNALTEGLMTLNLKTTMAPPFASDTHGYSRGILRPKLADLRGDATGFVVTKINGSTYSGLMLPRRTPFGLKLAAGPRPWDWSVDGVELQP